MCIDQPLHLLTSGSPLGNAPRPLRPDPQFWERLEREARARQAEAKAQLRTALEQRSSDAVAVAAERLSAALASPELKAGVPPALARVFVEWVRAWGFGPELDIRRVIDTSTFGLGQQAGYHILELAMSGSPAAAIAAELASGWQVLPEFEPGNYLTPRRDTRSGLLDFILGLPDVVDTFLDEHDVANDSDLHFRPARWFQQFGISSNRLRQAVRPARKTKKLRKEGTGRDSRYCEEDARHLWPDDFERAARAGAINNS